MRKSKTPHLVLVDERKRYPTGQCTMRCVACGDELTVLLPCSLLMLPVVMKQFEKEHRQCLGWLMEARAKLLGVLASR